MLRLLNIARQRRLALHCALLLSLATVACERVPLLAPTGSVITLTSAATAVPTNGSAQLIAQVLEPSGTPPHSGTHLIFTTTLGTIEPTEAETDINGRAIVMFRAGLANGTATITAASGGSAVATANVLKIAVGNAAVGSLSLTASPTTLPASGGSSTISATVLDVAGNALPGVNVSFTTDTGAVGPSSSTTNGNGVAMTTLTAVRTAKVTATAGIGVAAGTGSTGGSVQTKDVTVTVNVGPSISFGAVTPNPAIAGQAATVTLTVTAPGATQSPIRSIVVNWGDGQQTTVGSNTATLAHVFFAPGTYTITATATDTNGDSSQATTAVVVVNRPLPSVSISANPASGGTAGQTAITFTVTTAVATGSNASIQNTHIDFNDGTSVDLGAQTGTITFPHIYGSAGTFSPSATVTDTNGTSATAATVVIIK